MNHPMTNTIPVSRCCYSTVSRWEHDKNGIGTGICDECFNDCIAVMTDQHPSFDEDADRSKVGQAIKKAFKKVRV